MEYEHTIANQLGVRKNQVSATIGLLDSENTIPFIARYRKEVTGGLDEEQIRTIHEMIAKLRALDERREAVLKSINEQGKLTDELRRQIDAAPTLTALEDLYQPYKLKRRTRASIAREKGLQPLADLILEQTLTSKSIDQMAAPFLSDEVKSFEDAWAGASDIVAETISDHPEVRRQTREKAMQWGTVRCGKVEGVEDERKVYELYYDTELRVDRLRPHQVLAINRGEKEKILRVKIDVPERDWQTAIQNVFRPNPRSLLGEKLKEAIRDSAERLLLPAIERDVRRELTEKAENHAITVFSTNLRSLLNQPPLTGYTVMGIDPGFRTGSKVAVIDPTGKVLGTETIYPHEPQKRWEEALQILGALIIKYKVTLVSIGNGTASRETEQFVAELLHRMESLPRMIEPVKSGKNDVSRLMELSSPPKYLIVNEAGASVYSASPLARAELPDLDVSMRGAVSIARRVQDPLAELVKIDPKSIGVGLYQHDVDQKQLAGSLSGVVESVVNQVGVDANTASPALLTYVAGIGPKLAERIVDYRDENGPFSSRESLRNVGGLGPKAFEQAAGFLRIREGDNPLDASAIHPESYPVAQALLNKAGLSPQTPPDKKREALENLLTKQSYEKMAVELGTGIPTLMDIYEQLLRPGRDPRGDAPIPILRSDVLKMEDLIVGMQMKGTVRNVVDFGAFVDIGVKQDGLLHRTQIPQGTLLRVGDIINVIIQKVEVERGRIGLGWVSSG